MNATILSESRGRIRLQLKQKRLSLQDADLLDTWLNRQPWVSEAVVHERTRCIILRYQCDRKEVIAGLRSFTFEKAREAITEPIHSSRELDRQVQEKLVGKVLMKVTSSLFFPAPIRIARVCWHMVPFMRRGLHCLFHRQMKVELLDALSIGISACRQDFGTAGMVMFLLEIGELLEDWTHKKSIEDLAKCMSLNVDRVWLHTQNGEDVLTPISQITAGDLITVRVGGVVPVDGIVHKGEVMVNQASLTGESVPVAKRPGGTLYAGTVIEEGECLLEVKHASGQSRYDKIVAMIEDSQQLKSTAESKASSLADKLVP